MSQLRSVIRQLATDASTESMGRLVDCIEHGNATDDELACLAETLANSGQTLAPTDSIVTADIASTGGPSSLSTLLCPLYLRCLGYAVPALAVPGRPAGGVDVLAQIPGYKVDLTKEDAEIVLQACGYAHFVASRSFAPLDAALFAYRQQQHKVAIAELAITSLLAKKIAAGVRLVGLDVRVSRNGNFGTTVSVASQNADRFCRVARLLGRDAVCFLSDATAPYQPFIGRGEALVALWTVLTDRPDRLLQMHDRTCYAMANRLTYHDSGREVSRPTIQTMWAALRDNVKAQGATVDAIEECVTQVKASHTFEIVAQSEGFFHVDLNTIKSAIVSCQATTHSDNGPYSDPCGVILKSEHGDYVRHGDLLATVRCRSEFSSDFHHAVAGALAVKRQPAPNCGFLEVTHG